MTVFESWKDSLKLCKPQAIKLFSLVTLKSMVDALRVLCVPWFLIPVIFFVCLTTIIAGTDGFLDGVVLATCIAPVFFLIAARPSVGIKDFDYFRVNIIRAIWLILITLGITLLLVMPMFWILFIVTALCALMPGFFDFTILFYLDYPEGIVAAFRRSLHMMWYNYPLFVVYIGGVHALKGLITMFIYFVSIYFFSPALLVSSPFIFLVIMWNVLLELLVKCLVVNLYIKRIHDQYELYQ